MPEPGCGYQRFSVYEGNRFKCHQLTPLSAGTNASIHALPVL